MASAPPAIRARMLGSDTATGISALAKAVDEPSDNKVKYTTLDLFIIFPSLFSDTGVSDTDVIF